MELNDRGIADASREIGPLVSKAFLCDSFVERKQRFANAYLMAFHFLANYVSVTNERHTVVG